MILPHPSLRGIALLLLALAFFVLLDATAKTLAQRWPAPLLAWATQKPSPPRLKVWGHWGFQ